MPVNNANCFMMSQELHKAVKRFSTLEKSSLSCRHLANVKCEAGGNISETKHLGPDSEAMLGQDFEVKV